MTRDFVHFLRLAAVLAVFTAVVTVARVYFGKVPCLGGLPGDLSIPVGGSEVYLPIGSGVVTSFVLLLLGRFTAGRSSHRPIE